MSERAFWVVGFALALVPASAAAQASLIAGLGGPLDFGTDSLARGDDSISSEVDLTPLFPTGFDFYGHHYTSLFVNTNGNVSFGGSLATFTPNRFPLATTSRPMIAAWWGDVDTRLPLPDPAQNLVYWALDTTNGRFVATWTQVGYFSSHDDLLNSFQIVLTPAADGVTFEVELRYARCEWTTGDASGGRMGFGGTPAQAGFDAADGMNHLTLPGSRTMAVLELCTTSNVSMPGVWRLHGLVMPVCGNGIAETGEECDDGNAIEHDFCDGMCRAASPCAERYPDGGLGDPFAGLDAGDASVEPCTPLPGTDAGRRPDAGTRFDAGTPIDGGRDAGPRTNALDVTGGGCGCRAGVRGSSVGGWLALALAWITRIRARARARAGTSRRP